MLSSSCVRFIRQTVLVSILDENPIDIEHISESIRVSTEYSNPRIL